MRPAFQFSGDCALQAKPTAPALDLSFDIAMCDFDPDIQDPSVEVPPEVEVADPPIPPFQCPCPTIKPASAFAIDRTGEAGGRVWLSKDDSNCCNPNMGVGMEITVPCQCVRAPNANVRVGPPIVATERRSVSGWVNLSNKSEDCCTPELDISAELEVPCSCPRVPGTRPMPVTRDPKRMAGGKIWLTAEGCCDPEYDIGMEVNVPCQCVRAPGAKAVQVTRDPSGSPHGLITLSNKSTDCCTPELDVDLEINVPCQCVRTRGMKAVQVTRNSSASTYGTITLSNKSTDCCNPDLDVDLEINVPCACVRTATAKVIDVTRATGAAPSGTVRLLNLSTDCCDPLLDIEMDLNLPCVCPRMPPARPVTITRAPGPSPSGVITLSNISTDCCEPWYDMDLDLNIPCQCVKVPPAAKAVTISRPGSGVPSGLVTLRNKATECCNPDLEVTLDMTLPCSCVKLASIRDIVVTRNPDPDGPAGHVLLRNSSADCCSAEVIPEIDINIPCPCLRVPPTRTPILFNKLTIPPTRPTGWIKLITGSDCCDPYIELETHIDLPGAPCPCIKSPSKMTKDITDPDIYIKAPKIEFWFPTRTDCCKPFNKPTMNITLPCPPKPIIKATAKTGDTLSLTVEETEPGENCKLDYLLKLEVPEAPPVVIDTSFEYVSKVGVSGGTGGLWFETSTMTVTSEMVNSKVTLKFTSKIKDTTKLFDIARCD
jgi:hypothetical protein